MNLDIERECLEFEAWYEADALPAESDWFKKDDGGDYFHAATYSAWSAWLAAKRAVVGSAEPVGEIAVDAIDGVHLRVYKRWPDKGTKVYTAPPAPVSAEPPRLPIESAPKMTKVIAGYFNKCGKWRTITARYYVENTLQIDDDYRGDEEGYAPAGWYEESESHCENLLPVDEPPMFWMPLPPPPIKNSFTTDSGENSDG